MDYAQKKAQAIVKQLQKIQVECEQLSKVYGERAFKLIGDYPLYVGGLSNISYGTAIAVALMFGSIEEQEQADELMAEYFKTDRKHSIEDYDKWVAERSKK